MKVYMLTDQNRMTYNNTLWGENITHKTSGKGKLCSNGWLHFYYNPHIAVLLNPIHANIPNPTLWEAKAKGRFRDDHGLKGGCTKLTTIKQLPLPEITLEQKIEFGIRCVMQVCKNKNWLTWANKWLSGEDRSQESALAVRNAAYDVAYCDPYDIVVDATYPVAFYYPSNVAAYSIARAIARIPDYTEINFDAILKQVFDTQG